MKLFLSFSFIICTFLSSCNAQIEKKAEEPKTEEKKAEAPKAEEKKVEAPKAEEKK